MFDHEHKNTTHAPGDLTDFVAEVSAAPVHKDQHATSPTTARDSCWRAEAHAYNPWPKDSNSTNNAESNELHSSRTQKYFGGPGIVVMSLAAILIIGSIIVDATTDIQSSRYVAMVAALVFVGSTTWRAFRAARKAG